MSYGVFLERVMNKYDQCPECGKWAVHRAATCGGVTVMGDQDDLRGVASKYDNVEMELSVRVFAHVCFECGYLKDIGVEEPLCRQ